MEIQVNYKTYSRRSRHSRHPKYKIEYKIFSVKGKTLRGCLLTAIDALDLWEGSQGIIRDEVSKIGHRLSDEELLKRMVENGGDGCNDIISIIRFEDRPKGSVLYDSGDLPLNDRDTFLGLSGEPSYEEEVRQYQKDPDHCFFGLRFDEEYRTEPMYINTGC